MLRTTVEVIPHRAQRYETVGDYLTDAYGCTHFKISRLGDTDYEFLVSIHEQIESYLANKHGISEQDIDAFDMEYERQREPGDQSEPGDDPRCPVYREHQFATQIEKLLAAELGVDWDDYDAVVVGLTESDTFSTGD